MNKTFRSVWNASKQAYVAAAETVSAQGKPCSGTKVAAVVATALGGSLALGALAQTAPPPTALPTGGQVSAGQASITSSGANLVIDQGTQRASINWQSFNVGKDAQVQFRQPDASSVTLNRVMGADPSQIFGRITANGQVILTNPQGVYFAPGARVDVGGLVATTHGISDADFMAGKSRYERNGSSASVVNEGELRAALGGYIALLAPEVRNQGAIIAQMGTVAMAAGEAIDLRFDSNNRLTSLRVEPSLVQALVDNRHAVKAPGGLIILAAQSMDRLLGGVVKNSGRLEANGLQQQGGRIVLSASHRVENTGSLVANATAGASASDSGPAGRIEISAPQVANSGLVSATGTDPHGAGSVQVLATQFTQAAGGRIDLSAPRQGGTLAIQATGSVQLQGAVDVSATADAAAQGQGGQVDIRAQGDIVVDSASVDASGAQGGRIQLRAASGTQPDNPNPLPDAPGQGRLAVMANSLLSTRGRQGPGGQVELLGDQVDLLDATRIDASGATGGGSVRVGGDWQGSGEVYQARSVRFDEGAAIDASATEQGPGGKVVLWSRLDDAGSATEAHGTITARGGANGGAGGQVETSGGRLAMDGLRVDTRASDGSAGEWLLDPYNFFLSSSELATIAGNLASSNVTISTGSNAGGGANAESYGLGHIALQGDFNYSGAAARTLTFNADADIWVEGNVTASAGALSLNFNAPGDRVLLNGNVTTRGGSVSFNTGAVHFQKTSGTQSIVTGGGSLDFGASNIYLLRLPGSDAVTLDTGAGALNLGSGLVGYTTARYSIVADGANLLSWSGRRGPGVHDLGVYIESGKEYTLRLWLWDSWDGEGAEIIIGNQYYFRTFRQGGFFNTVSWYGTVYTGVTGSFGNNWYDDGYVDVAFKAAHSGNLVIYSGTNQDNWDESLEVQNLVRTSTVTSNTGYATGGRAFSLKTTSGAISGSKGLADLPAFTVDTGSTSSALSGDLSGSTALTKTGTGTLALTGSNTYTGATAISEGALVFRADTPSLPSGSITGTGTLAIEPASTSFSATYSFNKALGTSLTGLTLGKAGNTAGINVDAAIDVQGPLSIQGGAVSVNQPLRAAGDIALTATSTDLLVNKAITGTSAATQGLALKAQRHIKLDADGAISATSGALNTQLWADTNADGDGIILVQSSGITTRGGTLTLGKDGQTASLGGATVRVGGDVFFQRSGAQSVSTGGGEVNVYGETLISNTSGLTVDSGNANITFHGLLNSGNLYSFVDKTGSGGTGSWTLARTEARNGTAGGAAVGDSYLVTITSRLENAIAGLTAGYRGAWIGAWRPDSTAYAWTWADGPEGGQVFFNQVSGGGGSATTGFYSNFGAWEPNGALSTAVGTETVGQFYGSAGQWNDLRPDTTFSSSQSSQYAVLGYVRETNLAASPVTLSAGTGSVRINGGVGGTKELQSLGVTAASTVISGSAVKTAGNQTYSGTLAADAGAASLLVKGASITAGGAITATGANITLHASIASTAANAGLLFKATGHITSDANRSFRTNNGKLVFWSDSNADGIGGITLADGNTVNSANGSTTQVTGGGRIVLAGGLDNGANGGTSGDGLPDGVAASTSGDGIRLGTLGSATTTTALYSGGGDIVLRGKSTYASGLGVNQNGVGSFKAGDGTVSIAGTASAGHGVELASYGGSVTITAGGGDATHAAITVSGTSTSTGGYSGFQSNTGSMQATGTGGISVTGSASGTYYAVNTALDMLAASGPIELTAAGGTGLRYMGTLGQKAGTGVLASTSAVTLTGNALAVNTGIVVDTTGSLTVQPQGTSFTSALNWPLANFTLGAGVSGLTLGKSGNTANITLGSATTIAGPITVQGGDITLAANLASTLTGADILLKASGSIVQNAGVDVTTNGGDVTYWSDSDGNNAGAIHLAAGSSGNRTTVTTSGGHIGMGGGSGTGAAPTGFAWGTAGLQGPGVNLAGYATLDAGTGDITLRGRSGVTSGDYGIGVRLFDASVIQGRHIKLEGQGAASSGTGANHWGVSLEASSSVTASGTLDITGTGGGSNTSVGGNHGVLVAASSVTGTGTGAVTINGTGGGKSATVTSTDNDGIHLRDGAVIQSGAGTLTLAGTQGHNGNSEGVAIQGAAGSTNTLGHASTQTGAITVRANTLHADIGTTNRVLGTGTASFMPLAASASFGAYGFSTRGLTFGTSLSGLTLGKAGNTANVTIASGYGASIAGPITVHGAAIAVDGALTATGSTISLNASGAVTQGADLTASTLALAGAGSFTLTRDTNSIGTLTGGTSGARLGRIAFTNAGALTVGGTNAEGLWSTGDVKVETVTGDLSLTRDIHTLATTATAVVLNAARGTAAATASGGDVKLVPTVTGGVTSRPGITTGSGGRVTVYTGSLAGSTGVAESAASAGDGLVAYASGRFRYGSDEATTQYSTGLGTGAYVIYRERPVVTVTADSQTLVYGDTPRLSTTTSTANLANGDTAAAAVPTAPAVTVRTTDDSAAVAASAGGTAYYDVGSYKLKTATPGASSLGYAVTAVDGSLTVGKRTLQVVANNDAKFVGYDDANMPGYQAGVGYAGVSYSGFAPGENLTQVTTTNLLVSRSNAGVEDTGTYSGVLIPSGLSSANYSFNYVAGKYDIVPVDKLLVRVNDATVTYAGATPTLNLQASSVSFLSSADDTIVNLTWDSGANLWKDATDTHSARFSYGISSANVGVRSATVTNLETSVGLTEGAVVTGAVTVRPRALTLSATREYDGTSSLGAGSSGVTQSGTVSLGNIVSGETLIYSSAFAYGKDVSTAGNHVRAITLGNGTGGLASNYELPSLAAAVAGTNTVTITPRALTVSAAKTYDGSADVTAHTLLGNLVAGESLTVTSATASNAHVATASKSITSITLADDTGLAGNYSLQGNTLVSGQAQAGTVSHPLAHAAGVNTVSIGARPLQVSLSNTDVSKVYDGSTSAKVGDGTLANTVFLPDFVVGNAVDGDSFVRANFSYTAAYDSANVSEATALTLSGLTLSGIDASTAGSLASDYTFADTSTRVGARITPRAVAVSGTGVSKIYDGTTSMDSVSLGFTTVSGQVESGLVSGQSLTVSGGTGAFSSAGAGTGKSYSLSGYTLTSGTGTDAANYSLPGGSGVITGSDGIIYKRPLNVTFTGDTKVYDGTADATVTASFANSSYAPVASDDLVIHRTATYDSKNVGSGASRVTVSGVSISGAAAGNYAITANASDPLQSPVAATRNQAGFNASASGQITQRGSVTWVGGTTGEWFNPANWALTSNLAFTGVVPDLANVATVVIGSGNTVTFSNTSNGNADATQAVTVADLQSEGASLAVSHGTLNLGSRPTTLDGFAQTGGAVTSQGAFTVTQSFSQTNGTLSTSGDASSIAITQASGALAWKHITTGGNLTVSSAQGITFGDTTVAGDLSSTSGTGGVSGGIGQASGTRLDVTGTSSFIARTRTLQVAALGGNNLLGGMVSFTDANGGSWGDITVKETSTNGLVLGEVRSSGKLDATASGDLTLDGVVNVDRLALESTGGKVSQGAGSTLDVATGPTTLKAHGSITLDRANDFNGAVTVLGGTDVTLRDTDDLTLGAVTATGKLDAKAGGNLALDGVTTVGSLALESTAGAISQGASGTLDVTAGPSSLKAGGAITLARSNDFNGTVHVLGGTDVTLRDTDDLTLGQVTASGKLDAKSAGDLALDGAATVGSLALESTGGRLRQGTDGSLAVTAGPTDLRAHGSITLDRSNDFNGTVTVRGGTDVTLKDTDDLTLGAVTASGKLDARSAGDLALDGAATVASLALESSGGEILQGASGTLDVSAGPTSLKAQGRITLDRSNDFNGTVHVLGGTDVTLKDTDDLTLGTVTASGKLEATAAGHLVLDRTVSVARLDLESTGGTITQGADGLLNVSAGPSDLKAGGAITLDKANDFNGTVNVLGGTDVTLRDTDDLTLGTVTASGKLDAKSAGDLALDGAARVARLDLESTGGSIHQGASGNLAVTAGPTNLTAGGAIALDKANDFQGTVNARAGTDLSLKDTNALGLGTVTAGGKLSLDTNGALDLGTSTAGGDLFINSHGGNIVQAGPLQVAGFTTVLAGSGAVDLSDPGNQLQRGTAIQASTKRVAGDLRAALDLATSSAAGTVPQASEPGTSLSNAASPQPLVLASGAVAPGATAPAGGAASESPVAAGSTAGVTIDLRNAPETTVSMMAAVSLPKGTSTAGTGFSFELPQSIRSIERNSPAQASLPSGEPLPSWLRFDAQALRFQSTAVPDRALPLQVALVVGGQRVLVVISERTE